MSIVTRWLGGSQPRYTQSFPSPARTGAVADIELDDPQVLVLLVNSDTDGKFVRLLVEGQGVRVAFDVDAAALRAEIQEAVEWL